MDNPSSLIAMRFGFTTLMTYPLCVIKNVQQMHGGNCFAAARRAQGVFSGLGLYTLRMGSREIWVWPMVINLRPYLEAQGVSPYGQQILAGFAAASAETLQSPLESRRIRVCLGKSVTWAAFFKEGWKGSSLQMTKQSVHWVGFFALQKYYRDKAEKTTLGILGAGLKTGVTTCVFAAPFDTLYTLKQIKEGLKDPRYVWRGLPVATFARVIQTVTAVTLMNKLGQ
jgi:hypothetical protein